MPDRPDLNAIGLRHNTDKASSHHNYLAFYETHFAALRDRDLSILEVGVLNGASLKTWEEYFPAARIVGADINPLTRQYAQGRVRIEILDQSNIEELTQLCMRHGPFDIVIEDGSHMWEHQITSLRALFPFVKNGGLYIVEDLQTNFGPLAERFQGIASQSCVEYLKRWVDLRVADDQVPLNEVEDAFLRSYGRAAEFIVFYRHACLIRKRVAATARTSQPSAPLIEQPLPGQPVPVAIRAHVSHRGNLFGLAGHLWLGDGNFSFQGLQLDCAQPVLTYRVRAQGCDWSGWHPTGSFAGSAGKGKLLDGLEVRLAEPARFALRVAARFSTTPDLVVVGDAQPCEAPQGGALCGLQIDLVERPFA